MRFRELLVLILGVSIGSAAGLSTPFIDVQLGLVPVGKTISVETAEGKGMWINNVGDAPITVELLARVPHATELKANAAAIPSATWLTFSQPRVTIPAHRSVLIPLKLKIPNRRAFRGQTFQVMIWTRMIPENNQSMQIGAGLLSRLRFIAR